MVDVDVETPQIGERAPSFELPGTDGEEHDVDEFDAPVLAVVFTCNHCPYAQAYQDRIKAIQADYDEVDVVAINPNDAEAYPEDSFEEMVERAETAGFNFPYLRDESQAVAREYGAEATPHVFLFGADRTLRYEGKIDDDWEHPEQVERRYVREAIDALLAGEAVPDEHVAPLGCSIKWTGE